MRLIDTRFHYNPLPPVSRGRFKASIAQEDVEIVAQAVRPSGFVELKCENLPIVAVGYHPWYIDDNCKRELKIFRKTLPRIRFVGEIGLDFAPRRLDDVPAKIRIHVFTNILDAVQASNLSHTPSIHTVRSADAVLDLLEQDSVSSSGSTSSKNFVPILHRFGGTSDELTRLIRTGGYISVNPLILRTKRGRAYVSQMLADRLLLKIDLLRDPGNGGAVEVVSTVFIAALRDAIAEVAALRSIDEAELRSALTENAKALGI